jgi:hypothetical protein
MSLEPKFELGVVPRAEVEAAETAIASVVGDWFWSMDEAVGGFAIPVV